VSPKKKKFYSNFHKIGSNIEEYTVKKEGEEA
jgi:hypothetical protein